MELSEDGALQVQLDAEDVTDIQHEGAFGHVKVPTPFLVTGRDYSVETYEVLLDEGELTFVGLRVEPEPDQQLLEKEQVDSALKALSSNPFSGN